MHEWYYLAEILKIAQVCKAHSIHSTHTHIHSHIYQIQNAQPLKPECIESTLSKTSKPWRSSLHIEIQIRKFDSDFEQKGVILPLGTSAAKQYFTLSCVAICASGALYTESCALEVFVHRLWNSLFYCRHSFQKAKWGWGWLTDPTTFSMKTISIIRFWLALCTQWHSSASTPSNLWEWKWEHKYVSECFLLANHFLYIFWREFIVLFWLSIDNRNNGYVSNCMLVWLPKIILHSRRIHSKYFSISY